MRLERQAARACAIAAALFLETLSIPALVTHDASAYTLRPPILIVGNGAFTAANGVVRGTGTAIDPYVVAGWEIDTRTANGIEVRDTDAHFVIRDALLYSSDSTYKGTDGVRLRNVTNARVENVTARDNALGVIADYSSEVALVNNTVSSNVGGIWATNSANVTLAGNLVHDNLLGEGVLLYRTLNATVTANAFVRDGLSLSGYALEHYDSHSISSDNRVNGKPVYYYKGCNGLRVESIPVGQVIAVNCRNLVLAGLAVNDTDVGIFLYRSANVSVTATNASSSDDGILLDTSSNVSISDGSFDSNRRSSVRLSSATNTTLTNNTVFGGRGFDLGFSGVTSVRANRFLGVLDGVGVRDSTGLVVTDNRFEGGAGAIGLSTSSNVTILGNNLTATEDAGISIRASRDILLHNNTITDMPATGSMRIGLYVDRSSGMRAFGNTIANNAVTGAYIQRSSNTTIADNTVSNNTYGLVFDATSGTIMGNRFLENGGISATVRLTDRVVVLGNRFSNGSIGVMLQDSTNATVSGNAFLRSGIVLFSSSFRPPVAAHYDSHVIPINNTVNGRPVRYFHNCVGLDVDGAVAGQILVASCTGVRIANVTLDNTTVGIQLALVVDASAAGNSVTDTYEALLAENSANVTISGNRISGGWDGVDVWASANVSVTGNDIRQGRGAGVQVLLSSDVSVSRNDIADSTVGVDSGPLNTRVRVHHNNFLANTVQASDFGGPENAWDDGYPSGGNYWSNYTGADACSGPGQDVCPDPDGIGDTSFVIGSDSEDRYPLVAPRRPTSTPPVPAFAVVPATGDTMTMFTLDASGSSDAEDPPGAMVVRWDWEGDGAWDTAWSDAKTAEHRWTAPGTYTVRLEVRDTDRLTNTTTRSVVVAPHVNVAPTADFGVSPASGDISTTFTVDASSSRDLEDPATTLEVRWDWQDDGTWDTTWTTTKSAMTQFASPGTYTIRLEVRDGGGLTGQATRQLVVENRPPIAAFDIMPTAGTVGIPLTVNASGSSDLEDSLSALLVRWDWEDDGTWDTDWSSVKVASHVYPDARTYTIRLEVRDSGGLTGTATRDIVVGPAPDRPRIDATVAVLLAIGAAVIAVAAVLLLQRRRRGRGTRPGVDAEPKDGPDLEGSRPPPPHG